MPTPLEAARAFRLSLLQREATAELALLRAYEGIQVAIERRLTDISDRMMRAVERGETVNRSWLYEQGRLRELKRQIEVELRKYAHVAGQIITTSQARLLETVSDDVVAMLASVLSPQIAISFARLPISALQHLVGRLSDGSPVRDYLEKYARAYANHAGSILTNGLALGRNPRTVARDLINTAQMPRNRAVAIARDTMLGSYRDSTLETYRENSDIVEGWIWLASLGGRTCSMCVAMHGTFHKLSEDFSSHSMCRCTTIPALEPRSDIQSGSAWLARQPAWAQREVFDSAAAYRAYSSGVVKLQDFVGEGESKRWGPYRYQKSLKRVLGAEKAKQFYTRAN